MISINENYSKLQASYLFSDIAKRVAAFQKANPGKDVIKLGIGDVTLPAAGGLHQGLPQGRRRNGRGGHLPRLRARAGL